MSGLVVWLLKLRKNILSCLRHNLRHNLKYEKIECINWVEILQFVTVPERIRSSYKACENKVLSEKGVVLIWDRSCSGRSSSGHESDKIMPNLSDGINTIG